MNIFYHLAQEYINFEIAGKRVPMPYCIVRVPYDKSKHPMARTDRFHNHAGKGTPEQIRNLVLRTAQKQHFDLKNTSVQQITQFMINNGIGVDCSGFVYHILDEYLRRKEKTSLAKYVFRFPGIWGKIENFLLRYNRVRRSSAATLTNDLNTIKIDNVEDIQPGDMIRFTHTDWPGKHIAIIVEVDKTFITYAMSSEYMKLRGAHFGKIKIKDKNKGLESQEWLEKTYEGENYQKNAYDPQRGDSVRRLKYLAFSA